MITDEMIERGAKALYELHPLSAAMPMWENLNNDFKIEWQERIKVVLKAALGADKKSLELDAQCAMMRETLKKALQALKAPMHERNQYNCGEGCPGCQGDEERLKARVAIKVALSSNAGRNLLEQLRKLQIMAEAVGEFIQAEESDCLDVADECYGKLREAYEAWERSVYYA